VQAVRNFLKPGDVVLLKASRTARLERLAETLKSEKK
jgi:UDP-N-acetylmuramyl pentapeptide synthase